MERTMDMTIATPDGVLFEGKVNSAKFPGAMGAFMVLPMHAPLISALAEGCVSYTPVNGEPVELAVKGGFVEVRKDVISVCVET